MREGLKKIECDPSCGFMARSHNDNELVDITMKHAAKFHPDMKASKDEIKSMLKPVK